MKALGRSRNSIVAFVRYASYSPAQLILLGVLTMLMLNALPFERTCECLLNCRIQAMWGYPVLDFPAVVYLSQPISLQTSSLVHSITLNEESVSAE